ncbi:MAG: RNA repair domain-containing protein [Thermoplasmata archaeon]|nr:RNA repair domain-containing protein [Thermoplasmata archaeon]
MKKSLFPRDILSKLKWGEGTSLNDAEIVILHRGAPNDRRAIKGSEIISLGQMFFETSETSIPYHRIIEIWHRGEKVFEKRSRDIKRQE